MPSETGAESACGRPIRWSACAKAVNDGRVWCRLRAGPHRVEARGAAGAAVAAGAELASPAGNQLRPGTARDGARHGRRTFRWTAGDLAMKEFSVSPSPAHHQPLTAAQPASPHTAFRQLPLVDIAGLHAPDPATRRRTAEALGQAARDAGFLYIVGHGVPDALVAQLVRSAEA